MRGVLLVNMGGPESREELRQFYKLMFLDKHIIPAPFLIRKFLSFYISYTRDKQGWKRYEKIGGTPLKRNTTLLVDKLQLALGNKYIVKEAYSYSNPLINDALLDLYEKEIKDIIVVPLYPQASISTTSSVISDVSNFKKKYSGVNIQVVPEFYENSDFIEYWAENIKIHCTDCNLKKPLLLFSAHSIPVSLITKGDTYQKAIEVSAKLISEKAKLDFRVSYQSGLNPKTWLGPGTKEYIEQLSSEGFREIVIIPISFVSENLETLYDLDNDIVPNLSKKLQINLTRVQIPSVQSNFVNMLANFSTGNMHIQSSIKTE